MEACDAHALDSRGFTVRAWVLGDRNRSMSFCVVMAISMLSNSRGKYRKALRVRVALSLVRRHKRTDAKYILAQQPDFIWIQKKGEVNWYTLPVIMDLWG